MALVLALECMALLTTISRPTTATVPILFLFNQRAYLKIWNHFRLDRAPVTCGNCTNYVDVIF